MSRLRPALLAFVLLVAACAGRAPEPVAHPTAHVLEVDNALLWRVTGPAPDADPLHLLGSVHMLDVPLELGPRMAGVLADARELLVEVDTREIDPFRFLETAGRLGRLAPLDHLDEHVDPPTRERLDRFLGEHPAPPMLIGDLDHTAPWLLWFWVSMTTLAEWGLDGGEGVEARILARSGDKRVVGLETMTEQFEAMAAVPLDEQGEALAEVLAVWDEGADGPVEELVAMLDAWKAGDADALRASFQAPPGFERELLVRRNERMVTRIADHVREGGPRLAVVGAAHLVGEHSIVEGLRRRGYRVERVR